MPITIADTRDTPVNKGNQNPCLHGPQFFLFLRLFNIISDLMTSCKNGTKTSWIPFAQVSQILKLGHTCFIFLFVYFFWIIWEWITNLMHCLLLLFHCIFKLYLLIFRDSWRERVRQRNIDLLFPLFIAFIGWFLCVPWPGIEPATLEYQDDALINWATRSGLF